ncbi:MAG: amidase [Flavobacteriaceae bacterium]
MYHFMVKNVLLLFGITVLVSCASSTSETDGLFLEEATVAELQDMMRDGSLSAQSLVSYYLDRIEAYDDKVNSIIELNPDALGIARALDEERAKGELRGPLHGIPVLIKDNIDTGDQMFTTAGSMALAYGPAPDDAFVVKRLREAGAIILGKTNLSEWANFRSTRSSSGWSGRGGQTRNPYVLDRSPCGSSSGSGAAVSANFATLAVGTETNGSVVCPSSTNGVVGIKPTVGLVSRDGIIPISETQDTAGPMARTVSDAAVLLGAMAGIDTNDKATSDAELHADYTQFLDKNALEGKRIGILKGTFGNHERVDVILEQAVAALEAQGAEVIRDIELPERSNIGRASYTLMLYEYKDGLNNYFASRPDSPISSIDDLIAFNNENAAVEMPFFGQEHLERAAEMGSLEDPEYKEAYQKVTENSRAAIDNALETHGLDAIMGVTGGPAWTIDVINGDHFGMGSSSPAAQSGYPNITVPAGFVGELPVGVSFFAGRYQEPLLIGIAYDFEQATQARKAPQFINALPTE